MKIRPMALITSTSAPLAALNRPAPRPGVPGGIVDGPQQLLVALDEHQRFLLVEGMVAERDHVGAGTQQLLQDGFGDAEAAGGVLAVDGDEVELVARAQARQLVQHRPPAGAAHHVAEEQQTHLASLRT